MTEDARDALDDLFAAHAESGFVEEAWLDDHVNCCIGPDGDGVAVDVEVSHEHPDVDLHAVADDEPALETLDGDAGETGRAVVAALDDRASEPVESVPFAIIVDNQQGVRCASFRTRVPLADE
jgi:hypothetical protein